MAKKITKATEVTVGASIDEINIINPSLKNKLETIKEAKKEEEVTLVKTEKKVDPVKMVKVKLNCNHRCYIGGEWYTFQADKQYNVPENVKNILMGANLLLPL